MSHIAAPRHVSDNADRHLRETMPGHAFSLYFKYWNERSWEKASKEAKLPALQKVVNAQGDPQLVKQLLASQYALADVADAVRIEAKSTSPFVTGMGEEHAVENGFAFLSPYGLPYLAGSGVKGVIRRAAEELAAGLNPEGTCGWTFARVMWLFGYESDTLFEEEFLEKEKKDEEAQELLKIMNKENKAITNLDKSEKHFMGALSFWDVIIWRNDSEQQRKDLLGIDILTPHFGHYYQGDESPHDAGQPKPNPFLVVAPGATFTFHITCPGEHRLPESLQGEVWRELIKAAFNHAFEWGGFGAKTAVGYGVLQNMEAIRAMEQQRKTIRVGDKVRDTEANMDGIVKSISGDMAVVDFYGEEYEVELSNLEKLQ